MIAPFPRRLPRYVWLFIFSLLLCIAGDVLFLALPELFLMGTGFSPRGNVEDFWQDMPQKDTLDAQSSPATATLPPLPTQGAVSLPGIDAAESMTPIPEVGPALEATSAARVDTAPMTGISAYADEFEWYETPDALTISAEGFIQRSLEADELSAAALWVGEDHSGHPLGVIEFEETAVERLCERWLNNCETDRYLINRVDFKPGGMIIYGGVKIGDLWDQDDIGVAVLLDPEQPRFAPVGLVWAGTLYEIPAEGQITDLFNELLDRGNTALSRLIITANQRSLSLREIHITDERLVLILQ